MIQIKSSVDQAFVGKKTLMADALNEVMVSLIANMKAEAIAQINKQFYTINFEGLVQDLIEQEIAKKARTYTFPDASIPNTSIDFKGLQLSGDHIVGGLIDDFTTNGIEDRSTATQLTILDGMVVVENNLVVNDLSVKGNTVFEGDVRFNGKLPLDDDTKKELVNETTKQIENDLEDHLRIELADKIQHTLLENGIDVQNIMVNGRKLIDGEGVLGSFIKDTKITSTGELKELTVQGETLLSGSLYTSHNRVGINTTEPASALAIWDEETEIIIGKRKSQTGYIGSARTQEVVLGANNNQNIVLGVNGEVTVAKLIVGNTQFFSTAAIPTFDAAKGSISFNTDPKLNGVWGWMSLGEMRWAEMGKLI